MPKTSNLKRKLYFTSLLLLVGLLSAVSGLAQVTGRLSGTVVDPTGAVVPGAKVSLTLGGGKAAVLETETSSGGIFHFSSVRAETYDLTVEHAGFNKTTLKGLKVSAALETSVPAIKLEVAQATQTVEVSANVETVQSSTFEVGTTVTQTQVANLPMLDRQVNGLFLTQAGVTSGAGPTVINGMRTSLANVTLDGVNIQDNFIRTNSLDYIPNRLTISQVAEVTVDTSNANASVGGGAAQVVLITPSGTNEFHGDGFWYNRNSAFSANDWFNNRDGVENPFLNLNQLGGSIGGPVKKDKLFFYGYYEAYRYRATTRHDAYVPTETARNGIYTYYDDAGNPQQFDVLKTTGLSIDQHMASELSQIPTTPNNFALGDGVNYAGYAFNARNNTTRDNLTAKVDYNFSTKHVFQGSYIWNRDITDRPDIGLFVTPVPPVFNDNHSRIITGAWRWNPTATLTNELRGGVNFAPGDFAVRTQAPSYLIDNGSLLWDSPVNNFMPQGRATDSYHLQDNATWIHGRHTVNFGYQQQNIRVNMYDDAGIVPTYTLGIGSSNPYTFTGEEAPGINGTDLYYANLLLADLAGMASGYTQTFNVTSRNSGFVNAATQRRMLTYDNYAFYLADNWKLSKRLSLVLGLRYDYYTPLDEQNGLALLPVVQGNFISTLMNPEAQLDFAGKAAGRPFYKADRNNFAPNVGFAWDVFGNGKTAIRGGYSIAYVNDDTITTVNNNVTTNAGLSADASGSDENLRLAALPQIPVPEFKVPRTFYDNFQVNPAGNAEGMPDPGLRTPYVQQYSFGIQHEVKGFVVEARYVGNHLTKGLRAIDYNQVVIRENGFLDDFNRARSNGFAAMAAGRSFDARYNPAVPGSQPLTFFPNLPAGGALTNSTVRNYIRNGEPGSLGTLYQTNGFTDVFFRNWAGLGMNSITNFANSSYNGLQIDVRRHVGRVNFQANYAWSKVLGNSAGDGQARFEPFLDNGNPSAERSRQPFDLTHQFKINYSVPLPFGANQRFSYRPLNPIIGGWTISGFTTYQSGTPFSALSTRGTLNRNGLRSAENTAVTLIGGSELTDLAGMFQTGTGPYFINPKAIGSDGRGAVSEGLTPFAGQVFYNPAPGSIGTLQRRLFDGPTAFGWDFAILKDTHITERQSVQLRADFYNFLNHPAFYAGTESGDYGSTSTFNINSVDFGKITRTFWSSRVIQFGLHYKF